MARTDGHGNPPWTRDETILALALLFDAGLVAMSDTEPRVVRLSGILRALPFNGGCARNPTFRNSAAVSFKPSNLQNVATGNGFAKASKMDRTVWKQFEGRPLKLKNIAQLLLKLARELQPDNSGSDRDEEFVEGKVLTITPQRIERSPGVRKSLIKKRRQSDALRCDACGLSSPIDDETFSIAISGAPHLIPIAELGERTTRLRDWQCCAPIAIG